MAKSTNTKKVEIEVPEVFSAHLAAFLHNHPHVKSVWVNEEGDYSLHARDGYDEYSVDDNLKALEDYPDYTPPVDPAQVEALKKEVEALKTENAQLKEALVKATETQQ